MFWLVSRGFSLIILFKSIIDRHELREKIKIKNLKKGKPSEKKDAEKKDLKRDMKFDKDSKKKMEGDYGGGKKGIKPNKSYAQLLMDIAA